MAFRVRTTKERQQQANGGHLKSPDCVGALIGIMIRLDNLDCCLSGQHGLPTLRKSGKQHRLFDDSELYQELRILIFSPVCAGLQPQTMASPGAKSFYKRKKAVGAGAGTQ